MIRSMTAFGRAVENKDGKNITVELKSVNNRYLDCTVKMTRNYGYQRALEDRVRQVVASGGISRGKVDVYIGIDVTEAVDTAVGYDAALAKSYIEALRRMRDEFGLKDDISVMTVAQNRDLFITAKPEEDTESDWQFILPVLTKAIEAFVNVRAAEGERLKSDIQMKLAKIEQLTAEIAKLSENDIVTYRGRFETRLKNILADHQVELSEQMVLTECGIYADRVAIDEELVRLRSHFTAFYACLNAAEPVGRKLDFLLQEMGRETNTIGSKACDVSISSLVVEIKSELEKVREQVQNIE